VPASPEGAASGASQAMPSLDEGANFGTIGTAVECALTSSGWKMPKSRSSDSAKGTGSQVALKCNSFRLFCDGVQVSPELDLEKVYQAACGLDGFLYVVAVSNGEKD